MRHCSIMPSDRLCKPIDPYRQQHPVFSRPYPLQEYTLCIRPLCVSTDIELVCSWLSHQLGTHSWQEGGPKPELMQCYIDMLKSDYSQSFLCLMDEQPVCQVDVGKAIFNEVFMYIDTQDNDYVFRMIISPEVKLRNAYVNIVRTLLEYFFSFREVGRVLTCLPANDDWINHLLESAGLAYLDTRRTIYGVVNLYGCVSPS